MRTTTASRTYTRPLDPGLPVPVARLGSIRPRASWPENASISIYYDQSAYEEVLGDQEQHDNQCDPHDLGSGHSMKPTDKEHRKRGRHEEVAYDPGLHDRNDGQVKRIHGGPDAEVETPRL